MAWITPMRLELIAGALALGAGYVANIKGLLLPGLGFMLVGILAMALFSAAHQLRGGNLKLEAEDHFWDDDPEERNPP